MLLQLVDNFLLEHFFQMKKKKIKSENSLSLWTSFFFLKECFS